MKKEFLYFLVFIFFISVKAQERFKAGLKAGISTTQVEGDTYSGFHKAGMDAGIFVNGKVSENWKLQMELFFIQKGSKHNPEYEKGDYSLYYLNLNYIEIPLLLQYYHKKFVFEFGPAYSYLINSSEYNQDQELTGYWPLKQNEVSLGLGIGYKLYKRFGINWRYSNSITSIRDFPSGTKHWYNRGQRNNVLAFTITYQFGKY